MTIVLSSILMTSCSPGMPRSDAVASCISTCQEALKSAVLDSQCLGVLDSAWVCDVAHSPRQPQDDLVSNQCASYRDGTHTRFVEVTPDCRLIRAN